MIEEILSDGPAHLPHELSVVVPAYNEGNHVAQQVHELRHALTEIGWPFEIIVVDDGSSDKTASEADAAGARVLRRAVNRGYGAALKAGIDRAKYDWILITDADGTYPVEAIAELLKLADHSDMVVGARLGNSVKIPLVRRPAKWFLTRLASYLAGQRLPDINSGLRLMRKSLVRRYESLLPDGFSFTTTITLSATCNGHVVNYVPINYGARLGKSKIRPRHAYDFTLLILRTIVLFNPLKVFIPLGFALLVAAIAKFAFDVWIRHIDSSFLLTLIGPLIIWSLGLLADQNIRISRPRR